MTYEPNGAESEPVPSPAARQARATRSSRGSVIVAIISGVVAIVLTTLATGVVINARPPIELDAESSEIRGEDSPTDNDFFTKVWLSDVQIDRLDLEPMGGTVRSQNLQYVIRILDDGWRTAKGQPEECRFAGWYPGNSVYPVTGLESDDERGWVATVVSGTQQIGAEGIPYISITTRIFDDEAHATDYLAGWDAAVSGCPAYTTEYNAYVTTAHLEPLHFDELVAENSGWRSSVPELNSTPTADAPVITSAEFFVLDIRQENVVVRVTMFTETAATNADEFLHLAGVVSDNLERALQ